MARKAITERMKIDALLWHASLTPFPIRCGICRERIIPMEREKGLEWDHIVPIGLEGLHSYCNLQPLHKTCHAAKTRGKGATTAGSDIGKISKERRIVRTCKFQVNKPELGTEKPQKRKRKLQSKGFDKRHRPMNWRKSA